MAVAKVVQAQRNFSGGEADTSIKRADEIPLLKVAGRQMRNWRVTSSGSLNNRPGRSIVGLEGPRVEEVFMRPAQQFYLAFGNGYLRVYNAAFTKVFDTSGISMPWTTTTAQSIVWVIDSVRLQIFIFLRQLAASSSFLGRRFTNEHMDARQLCTAIKSQRPGQRPRSKPRTVLSPIAARRDAATLESSGLGDAGIFGRHEFGGRPCRDADTFHR